MDTPPEHLERIEDWRNCFTHAFAIAIDNDRDRLATALKIARETGADAVRHHLAPLSTIRAVGQKFKEWAESTIGSAREGYYHNWPQGATKRLNPPGWLDSLHDLALAYIDWQEIAAHYLAKVEEDATA